MKPTHRYAFPDRFVTGAVGESGRRVYFVQARKGSRMTNVVCEPAQIKVLAQHLQRVLAELEGVGVAEAVPDSQTPRPLDVDPLDVPLDEDFRVGTMAITWVPEQSSLRVELYARGAYHRLTRPGAQARDADLLQVVISLDQARDFIARTDHILAIHAPSCPFCAQPIEASGHLCPRVNGYRRPLLDAFE